MNSNANFGERMRRLRLASDLSQIDLAKRLHMDGNSQVSKLENGRILVDDETAAQVAAALECSPEFLRRSSSTDVLVTRPWLRAYADASTRAVEGVIADNQLHYEVASILDLQRLPDRIPRFVGDPCDDHAIEEFAEEVRAASEIAEEAIVGNAMRAAERLGCVILPLSNELGRHLGLSQFVDGVPYLRVSRARTNVPGDRQRFTICHELGHLALHADLRPPETAEEARRIESQANRFAGAFLAPKDALLEDLETHGGRVTLSTLAYLKAEWGVAIKMLVFRFKQLGVVSDDQATSLYKQISKRGWNSKEPVSVSNEEPIWLIRALAKRLPKKAAIEAAATSAGLGISHFYRWVEWSAVESKEPERPVISLEERLGARGRVDPVRGGQVAEVTRLSRRRRK